MNAGTKMGGKGEIKGAAGLQNSRPAPGAVWGPFGFNDKDMWAHGAEHSPHPGQVQWRRGQRRKKVKEKKKKKREGWEKNNRETSRDKYTVTRNITGLKKKCCKL